jgi:hypothetical protein
VTGLVRIGRGDHPADGGTTLASPDVDSPPWRRVRTGLSAGGNRIRTIGPALRRGRRSRVAPVPAYASRRAGLIPISQSSPFYVVRQLPGSRRIAITRDVIVPAVPLSVAAAPLIKDGVSSAARRRFCSVPLGVKSLKSLDMPATSECIWQAMRDTRA